MVTINSISGGKTSSYMSVHFPADHEIFSLVMVDDVRCAPKDKGLVKYVSEKLNKEFVATAESDLTLRVVMDLEQLIGRKITWVSGLSFDDLNRKRKMLPNKMTRFCTTEMKMRPIFDWWYNNVGEVVRMGIGFRYDEMERAARLSTSFNGIIGQKGGRNMWKEIEWREGYFPLIENRVNHWHVNEWAKTSGLFFPQDSNCVGCFHKPLQQLRKNWEDEPLKMQWFADQEIKSTWKSDTNYNSIKKLGLQQEFLFGTGSGCQGGFCTD